jgi:AcrR family transcriptional regulator
MGTKERRARSKENLREEILDAARTLFIKEGFENVSIRKIADKIEYAPGTIYLYFKDKVDIFQTLCEETFGKLHARLNAIASDNAPPLEKIRRAGRAYVHFALEHQSHYTMVFLTQHGVAPPWPSENEAGYLCYQDVCHIVQQCIEADLLRGTDAMEMSQALWAAVHGVSALLMTKKDFPFVEQTRLIERVIDMAVEGLRKPN